MKNIEKEIQKNHWETLAILSEFEDFRKKRYKKILIFEALAFIFLISGPISSLFFLIKSAPLNMNEDITQWICWGSVFTSITVCVLLVFVATEMRKEFKNQLKNKCFCHILEAFGNIKWYENKEEGYMERSNVGLSNDILERSALFITYNRRHIDDEFIGKYNGVNFKISETDMQYVSGSSENGAVVNVFKGVVVQFDSNKKVLNRTIVATKGDAMTSKNSVWITIFMMMILVFNIIANFYEQNSNGLSLIISIIILVALAAYLLFFEKKEPLNKVALEDPKFNKKFNVYSSDQVEARYLITPSFMERLNNLTTAFGCKDVKCSFFDDKFMIAISTKKDLFEIGKINAPLSNPETLENFYKELSSIYEMIDYFKLDEKTGI